MRLKSGSPASFLWLLGQWPPEQQDVRFWKSEWNLRDKLTSSYAQPIVSPTPTSQVSPTQIFTTKLRFKHMALEADPEAWPVCQVQNCQYQFSCYVCAAPGRPLLVLSGSLVSGVLSRNILSLVYLEHIPKFTFWWRMKQGPITSTSVYVALKKKKKKSSDQIRD